MNVSKKVAVVGAGAAGLAAAQRLKEAGFKVTVFERSNRIGGKCYSVACKDAPGIVELGAIQVGTYPLLNRYRRELGLTLRDYWPAQAMYFENQEGASTARFEKLSKDIWPLKDLWSIRREASTMSAALARFRAIDESHFTEIPTNSEFAQNFGDWADGLSLPHFKREYSIWMTAYGYGQLSEVPTYLALSLLNSSYGLIAMRRANMNLRMLSEGYGGFLNTMVEHYQLNVKTNTNIEQIDRFADRVQIKYTVNQYPKIEEFGYLVIASGMESIPLLLGPNATANENKLVRDTRYSPYDVVIAYIPGLAKGGYVMPQFFERLGHVVMISKNSSGGEEAILYIPRAGFQKPSWQEIGDIVSHDMALFGFQGVKILQVAYWDNYFPHFHSISSYKLLEDIQGLNRTIHVGGIARFEIVERAMQHAHDMVDKHIIKPIATAKPDSTFQSIKDYLSADAKDK